MTYMTTRPSLRDNDLHDYTAVAEGHLIHVVAVLLTDVAQQRPHVALLAIQRVYDVTRTQCTRSDQLRSGVHSFHVVLKPQLQAIARNSMKNA